MKVSDIYKSAIEFMGYGYTTDLTADFPMPSNPLSICNRALNDLGLEAAVSIEQEVNADETILDALCYGVAMFVCVFSGDSSRQPIYTQIYNAKRAKALSKIETIKDVMVYGEG